MLFMYQIILQRNLRKSLTNKREQNAILKYPMQKYLGHIEYIIIYPRRIFNSHVCIIPHSCIITKITSV
jgi:hypothetical protein